jgi:hypothetical protein
MDDAILIETILEAQPILARHVSGEHASADDTIANLFHRQLVQTVLIAPNWWKSLPNEDIRAGRFGREAALRSTTTRLFTVRRMTAHTLSSLASRSG